MSNISEEADSKKDSLITENVDVNVDIDAITVEEIEEASRNTVAFTGTTKNTQPQVQTELPPQQQQFHTIPLKSKRFISQRLRSRKLLRKKSSDFGQEDSSGSPGESNPPAVSHADSCIVLRISHKNDIETQTKGSTREFLVQDVTHTSHKVAGGGTAELVLNDNVNTTTTTPAVDDGSSYLRTDLKPNETLISVKDLKQYRLTARRRYKRWSWNWLVSFMLVPSNEEDVWKKRHSFHNTVTRYLNWTFRVSFLEVILVSALAFWVFSILFAIALYVFAHFQPSCIQLSMTESETDSRWIVFDDAFADAFQLSWTTFSTVGYGLVYPNPHGDDSACIMVNMFTSFESFTGVIFSGFVGAIIFGKIARIQSHANVIYSDPIVVRYGTGVLPEYDEDNDDENRNPGTTPDGSGVGDNNGNGDTLRTTNTTTSVENESATTTEKRTPASLYHNEPIPFPALEFRLVNRLYGSDGGEIINASVNVSAVQLASKVAPPIQQAADPTKRKNLLQKSLKQAMKAPKKTKKVVTNTAASALSKIRDTLTPTGRTSGSKGAAGSSILNSTTFDTKDEAKQLQYELDTNTVSLLQSLKAPTAHDEDPTGALIPRRIFSNVQVEPSTHPFFKRVWVIRHTLDANSPLLTRKARKAFKEETQGLSWPPSLNDYAGVRESIHFHQLVVTMSGTAHNSSCTVYGQKTYEFCDVNIGYSFANVLRKVGISNGDSDNENGGELTVDIHLLNDVVVQRGGGAEPFVDVVNPDETNVGGSHAMEAFALAAHIAGKLKLKAHDAQDRISGTSSGKEKIVENDKKNDTSEQYEMDTIKVE